MDTDTSTGDSTAAIMIYMCGSRSTTLRLSIEHSSGQALMQILKESEQESICRVFQHM
jgi:hypothetical protein